MVTSLWFPRKINDMTMKISATSRKGAKQPPHLSSALCVYLCTLPRAQITEKEEIIFFRWGPHQGAVQTVPRQMGMSLAKRREELLARPRCGVMCLSVMFWGHQWLLTTVSVGGVSPDRNQEGSRRCGQLWLQEFEPESTRWGILSTDWLGHWQE